MESLSPRIGMRYGPSGVWYLKPGSLFLENGNRLIRATIKRAGMWPRVPSLKAAVEGIHQAYDSHPIMGTDPEFFLRKQASTEIVPAFDHLPDKHASLDGLFWDGFQAETTVQVSHLPALAKCHQVLVHNIAHQIRLLATKGLNVAPQPIWRVPSDMLQWASEAHVALGCDPSRNAYGSSGRFVEEPRKLLWRFAGGHVHFALEREERTDSDGIRYLVKCLDALLGVPCVALAQNYDHFIRRRYYGLAGEYRLPPHGLEYRVLSNFWLMDPRAFMLIFDLGRHALNLGRTRMRGIVQGSEKAIQDTINFCDVRSAKDFMRLNKAFYTAWAELLYGSSRPFWEAINGGVDKVLPSWGTDVVKAWTFKYPGHNYSKTPAWADLS